MKRTKIIDGSHGDAYMVDVDAARARAGRSIENEPSVAHYVCSVPNASPHCEWYSVVLIHLRIPGSVKRFTNSTHEVWLYPIHRTTDMDKLFETGIGTWIEPANFLAQINAPTDATALEFIEAVVTEMCNGELHPENYQAWAQRFNCHNPSKVYSQ